MTIQLYDLVGKDKSRPFSPHCWKIKMALAHKGLDHDVIPSTFLDVPKIENGLGKIIPVLRDGDEVINESFDIALYLEQKYPDTPSLFGGEGGLAMARFLESWSLLTLHPLVGRIALEEIWAMQEGADKDYFRESRESRMGVTLEDVTAGRGGAVEALPDAVKPLRHMLKSQKFIGGDGPLFADYIVFGVFQWCRICSTVEFLPKDDPVMEWFERCLDLHDGFGRSVTAASN